MPRHPGARTVAAANGIAADPAFGAVAPPLYLSTTYAFGGFAKPRAYDYSRGVNPSRDLLADTIAKLEGGAGAVVVSSGMAAVDLVLSTLPPGGLVVAPHDCYAGTQRLLNARHNRRQLEVAFIDQEDESALSAALGRKPALVLLETPSNPLMRIVDIRAVSERAHAIGAKTAVDNTFLSPALQQPIRLGADFAIHSTTKFLNGHSDVVGGAVVAATSADVGLLADWANTVGTTGSPFDAYLTLRGVRTLFARLAQQQQTAASLATFLEANPLVKATHYPGLVRHPSHALARAQQSGFGAMLSFELNGSIADLGVFVEALRIFTLAELLGGVESLIAHPATMTHVSLGPEGRQRAGISDMLLRLSVGLETPDDLVEDLRQAFAAIAR